MGQGPLPELNLFSLLLHFNKVNLRKKWLNYGYTSTDLVYIAVGYASDDINLVYTAVGYARPISQVAYTAVG